MMAVSSAGVAVVELASDRAAGCADVGVPAADAAMGVRLPGTVKPLSVEREDVDWCEAEDRDRTEG